MKAKPGGNGSGRIDIACDDMGGWVRVRAVAQDLPPDVVVFLSQALSDWFRKRPHLGMRCVMPGQGEGDTVEIHAWYDAHLFPALQGRKRSQPGRSDRLKATPAFSRSFPVSAWRHTGQYLWRIVASSRKSSG
jgi:hypothetical protein